MEQAGILLTPTQAARWANRAPKLLDKALARGLGKAAMVVLRIAKEIIYQGHDAGHLNIDKGHLRRSLTYRVHKAGGVYAEVGTNVVYAAIHEFGGTIRPKRAKALAIPVGDMKGSPRDHAGLWLFKRPGRAPLLVDQSFNVQYVLKSSVRIPARPYLRPAMAQGRDEAAGKLVATVEEALRP
ncbi:MAG: HK97 gp10 family phage protein [Veillonellaceae bacterium]|nr:HK97 gp10 family phage protein [Veillonellaceae bacterium]